MTKKGAGAKSRAPAGGKSAKATGTAPKTSRAAKQSRTRQVKVRPYKSFRLSKRIKHDAPVLPGALKLLRRTLDIIRQNWKTFTVLLAVYSLLTLVVVKGFGISSDTAEIKALLDEGLGGFVTSLLNGLTLLEYLFASATVPATEAAGVYQAMLLMVVSLAIIYIYRQLQAGHKVSTREAFYNGMYPFVPFILVMGVIGLQLLPLFLGTWLYGVVVQGGIAVLAAEKLLWGLIASLLALFSLYMLTSSIFAAYVVTLPNMRPLAALRSARELVRYRRWLVTRRLVALPFLLVFAIAVIMLPLVWFVPPVAEWIFFVISMLALIVVHGYMYNLYRELL